jgi:hypothetical protein
MHVKKDLKSLVAKVLTKLSAQSGAFQFDDDMENLFQDPPFLDALEDASSGAMDGQPRKTLRNRQYGPMPLMLQPEYKGDFLDKLREKMYKDKCAASDFNLMDFSNPEEMLKYIPTVVPRDLQDEFYDINRPGQGAGYDDLQDYHDRGWDENDAPEISEDKILRLRNWNKSQIDKIVNAFIHKNYNFRLKSVVAKFLMKVLPSAYEIDLQQRRVAKLLSDFQNSLIYTKSKGWRKPEESGVSVRLVRAEPRVGRWTFMTSSGKESYSTIFQFIPRGSTKDPNKLQVRVSCTCPSWLFWGAQYNAMMEDYLYGRIRPKFTPPSKRDPTGRFLVCKHVLACIPIVSRYKLAPITEEVKIRLKRPLKIEIEKDVPKEKIRIPQELKNFSKREDVKDAVKSWTEMPENKKQEFIMGLDSPGAVAFMAHRFPETATEFVVKKLKEMALTHKIPSMRVQARKFLREIV